MIENREYQWNKEIKLLLLCPKTAERTALESLLGFDSHVITIHTRNCMAKLNHALTNTQYDMVLMCINTQNDNELKDFIQDHPELPVIVIDNYYNPMRAADLLENGALDYLDMGTLDSRLLVKTIIFSIQRKQAENYALLAQKRMKIRSTFLANMSHEIRTPLNSIIGFSELLYDDETDAVKREKLNMIRQSGKHLLTLINGILDYSKLEAGKIKPDAREFSIDDLVMSLYYMMLVKIGDKNIDLNIKPIGRIPDLVLGDEFRINQILINLMNNAIKFTEAGSVTLEYEYAEGKVIFKVKDTGIGIPPERQQLIFNAFEQVYNAEANPGSGTGLGLAISINLANLLQGDIEVSSEPQIGSTFTVTIPLPLVKWHPEKDMELQKNRFPQRRLGIIYSSFAQREAMQKWLIDKQIDALWAKPESWQNEDFLAADMILIPQSINKIWKTKISQTLLEHPLTAYKPKIFFLNKNEKNFFVVDNKIFQSRLIELEERFLNSNLKIEDLIIFINSFFSRIEDKGKDLVKTWKKNFLQENPGLEDVLFEAILRMEEKIRQLSRIASQNNHQTMEEIAHSLKGFTGQTCIIEISRSASILLNEMRSDKKNPRRDVIMRELAFLNEIIYILPRKYLKNSDYNKITPILSSPQQVSDMKVIVAEDNPINQAVIKDFLSHINLPCSLAANGQEALDMLKSQHYDILFLDIQMPVLNGIETLKRIRSDEKLKDIFVVALTAYVVEIAENEYLQKNCDAILTKPFEKKELIEIIDQAREYNRNKAREA